ncbi:MAG: AMP-binding protein, partial [Holophagales bacterium]|nr:AMP-binding protein [Holophagales bacterium]
GKHGQSFAHAPNFGFQLCLERLGAAEIEGLDLGSWRYAMTGAEMVRPETVAGFCERFAAAGFRPEAFRPCYGLAEATLAVTLDRQGRGLRTRPLPGKAGGLLDPELQEVASVGEPIPDTSVRIVAPDGRTLADGEVGEVRVSGPGVFSGYWNDAEATAEALVESGPERELRTGDLGFLHGGELYFTGRTKDLLIVRGNNVMPHEIEWLAENVTGGGGAARSGAFSIVHGSQGEQAVVVVESQERDEEKLGEMARAIQIEVSEGLGLSLADVRFVRRGRIPKTTSGKVQRRALRELYLRGELS